MPNFNFYGKEFNLYFLNYLLVKLKLYIFKILIFIIKQFIMSNFSPSNFHQQYDKEFLAVRYAVMTMNSDFKIKVEGYRKLIDFCRKNKWVQ
jgi:hypothetical protein